MTIQRIWDGLLLLFTIALLTPPPAECQVATADVTGMVTDNTGAVMPNAMVKIENQGTNETRATVSGLDGAYAVTLLQPGSYVVTITAPRFKSFVAAGMVLVAGDRVRLDAALQVGPTSESVDVTTQPSSLQMDTINVGSSVDGQALQDLPLNGRNFMSLLQVAPGVNAGTANSLTSGNRPDDRRQSSSISANGQYELVNNQMIDGLDNNERYKGLTLVRPSVEAIQQVVVDTNLYTAEVGRTAGASVNVITKAGTNSLHGSLFEYFRNDVTDAKNFFATGNKPELRQNQFGGSIDGPIIHDQTFFFADLEGFKQVDATGTVYLSTVPTLYEEQHPGDLSDIGGPVIPPGSIDPTSLGYFKLYPAPNQPGTISAAGVPTNNYLSTPAKVQNTILGDIRIDHHFNSSNLLFGRYSYNKVNTLMPSPLPSINGVAAGGTAFGFFPGNSRVITHDAQLNYTHIFTPRLLGELKGGYVLFEDFVTSLNNGKNLNDTAQFSIPNANTCLDCSGLASVNINSGGYAALGDPTFLPILLTENNYQSAGSLIYTRGNHIFKIGAALDHRLVSNVQNPYGPGYIRFTGTTPQATFASFFKGSTFIYQRQMVLVKPYLRVWEPSFFAQDNWRIRPNLTLNLGLRYDVFTAPSEKNGNYANLNLATAKLIVGKTAGVNTSYVNLAPRVGFAYTPMPNTVIRGGFGLTFYPSDIQNAFQLQNAPLYFSSGTLVSPTPLSTGLPLPQLGPTAISNPSGAVATKPLNFRDAYVEQFNLLVQKDLAGNVFTVGYVGELGRHMMSNIPNLDLPAPGGPSPAGTPPAAQPYAAQLPLVNTISEWGDFAVSSYNSLQASVERRLSKGLTFNVNYTWAHSLDNYNATTDGEAAYGLQPLLVSTYDYGNSFLDIRNRIGATANYEIPTVRSQNRFLTVLTRGWQMNALCFWQTGSPFSISSAYIQNGLAQINLPTITVDRPDRIASAKLSNPSPTHGFFNVSAFAKQALGTAGDAGKNPLYGPHLRRTDLSVVRLFPIYDQIKLQFRVECFNFTNTPNFNLPNGQLSSYSATPDANGRFEATNSGNFGNITSTSPGSAARQFQFALKVLF